MNKNTLMAYFILGIFLISFVYSLDIPAPPSTPGKENSTDKNVSLTSNFSINKSNLVFVQENESSDTSEKKFFNDLDWLILFISILIAILVIYYSVKFFKSN